MWPMSFPYPERRPLDVAGRTYDYVIVGGGTAGCVLASRLSEDLSVSVLVLEKGYVRDHALSRIPTLSQDFSRNDLQVVKFKAEPVSEMPTDGGRQNVKEGIVLYGCDGLGGASRINGMMLTRGWVGEYQAWADDLGLDEWGWKDVEPYFDAQSPFRLLYHLFLYIWYGLGLIASPTTALVMFLQSYTLNDKTMEARRTHPDSTLSTLDASKKSNIPDFEVQITPLPCFQPTFERVTALKDTDTGKDVPAFTLWPVLMSPFSRGRVELVDADMATPPRIIHPFFTDIRNHDISVMKKALRFCMRLSEAFMKSEGQVGDDKYPYLDRCSIFMGPGMDDGMGEYEASGTGRKTVKSRTAADVTDIELETFIYRWFGTGYHQAEAERPFEKRINGRTGGVVDQHLRVFGVSGLRVADASIFPVIPSTHPMIPTMMVAERCARFLKSYE
ncbi:hypothetical protein PLIIFM63780_007897 [Purpureocillium lilacinum]|nr:hypothetical protein PLIIFM63780_007897 [Purpureocillium lilacinum]